jgi:UDP-arabinose 4-epimerase
VTEQSIKDTVLVTGGAGYIGSHACKALALGGYQPVVYDNLSTGFRHNVKWGTLELGDVIDQKNLQRVISKHRPIAVLHFAGSAYVGESMADPGKYFRNNICTALSLLNAMRESEVDTLVFSSTCATYGVPEYLPLKISHPQRPISPYGFSKFAAEQMIKQFASAHQLKYGILRYFNAAGADDEGDLKEEHDPETHLIPLALKAAIAGGPPLKLYGTDYPTKDGTCIRDYVHVSALAEAHLNTLKRLLCGETNSEIRNLGSGKGYSVREVVAAIDHLTGCTVPVVEFNRRPGDPAELWAESDEEFLNCLGPDNLQRIVLTTARSLQAK